MMIQRLFLFTIGMFFLSAGNADAQDDFFFSFSEGGANMDQSRNLNVGDSGSLFVYWTTNGPEDSNLDVGAFLDVFTDVAGVIEFTRTESFDFDITVGDVPIDNRWLDDIGGGGSAGETGTVFDNLIDEWNAFTVTGGQGILEENNGSGLILDRGYDASNDGFLWGQIDFNVIGHGTTKVTAMSGDGMIVNAGVVLDEVAFTTATINVGLIPEPTTTGFLAIGFAFLATNRRR